MGRHTTDTDEQLRAKLDQAMIYAPSKWSSYVLRIAQAYEAAYKTQAVVLKSIAANKRAEAELASFMLSIILPSLLGGFVGAVIGGKGKQAIDAVTGQAAKFKWGLAVDTAKTMASDITKYEVKNVYQGLAQDSAWEPGSMSPLAFQNSAVNSINDFMTAAADALNESRVGRSKVKYRDVVAALYYGPFVRSAPEGKDQWTVDELSPVLEVFLWADWANHRDTKYWVERISRVTEEPADANPGQLGGKFFSAVNELKDLNPILERLDRCHVRRDFDTGGIPALKGYRFLNILWLRHLAPRYTGTLLGDLLKILEDKSPVQIPFDRRPKGYHLM